MKNKLTPDSFSSECLVQKVLQHIIFIGFEHFFYTKDEQNQVMITNAQIALVLSFVKHFFIN
jgi:hypothetical protein